MRRHNAVYHPLFLFPAASAFAPSFPHLPNTLPLPRIHWSRYLQTTRQACPGPPHPPHPPHLRTAPLQQWASPRARMGSRSWSGGWRSTCGACSTPPGAASAEARIAPCRAESPVLKKCSRTRVAMQSHSSHAGRAVSYCDRLRGHSCHSSRAVHRRLLNRRFGSSGAIISHVRTANRKSGHALHRSLRSFAAARVRVLKSLATRCHLGRLGRYKLRCGRAGARVGSRVLGPAAGGRRAEAGIRPARRSKSGVAES
jgi:hypothetical protein